MTEKADDILKTWGQRETAVELPIDWNVNAYLMNRLGIPKQWASNDLVYHYTDASGLQGIVEDRAFWATNSRFLNDPTEVSHAIDVASRVLHARSSGTGPEAEVARRALQSICARDGDVYVTSFCRNGDLLSQWRGYGAFGAGYALGFGFAFDQRPPLQVAWVVEVLYDDAELEKAINEVLDIYAEHLAKAERKLGIPELAEEFSKALDLLSLGVKHPTYSEEQEVRLLASRSANPDLRERDAKAFGEVFFRASAADVIPYLKIGISFPDQDDPRLLPLKRITVGPGVEFERNQRAVRQMLTDSGYGDVDIVRSSVPFRP